MLHFDDIKLVLDKIKYKDWTFYIGVMGDGFYVQIRFYAPDALTGEPTQQHCRKWYLSRHMTPSEIVQTAWAAVQAAELHESRELFSYKGSYIFKPHYDIEDLVDLAYRSVEVRK